MEKITKKNKTNERELPLYTESTEIENLINNKTIHISA